MPTVGFIILRHVNSPETNIYWKICYNCIRNFYPENNILIIDDSSDPEHLTIVDLYKTTIINSEFPKRGEVLPYYYYLQNKLFDTAVILHDSVFIQQKIDFEVDKYKILWTFEHHCDQIENETEIINTFNCAELSEFHKNKSLWKGCFGGMSIITHDYLTDINSKYNISKLLNLILTRYNRMSFERVIACLLQKNHTTKSLLGDIHQYCPYGINIGHCNYFRHLPLLKIWTGR